MKNGIWISWPALLVACLCAAGPLRSAAQTNLAVNAAISPPISTNLAGSTIVLSATQDVQSIFFDYEWTQNGRKLIDSGIYTVNLSVTGALQATASSLVYVVAPPAIQSLETTTSGAAVTLTANATGGLLAYQWSWQGQPIPGATSSVLTFANAYNDASAGFYSVTVTNPMGETSFSGPGFLFTKPTPSGTYQGLFFDTNNVTPDSSGFFQYTLSASKRSFSGKIILGVKTYPFSGAFSLAHDSQVL